MSYTLPYLIEVNGDTITEVRLVCDTKYISLTQKKSCWYLEIEVVSIYTTIYLYKILVPNFNVESNINTL